MMLFFIFSLYLYFINHGIIFFFFNYYEFSSLYSFYIFDYVQLFFIVVICAFFSFFLNFLATRVSPKLINEEKSSGYECGYEPFEDARVPFNVQFYLVSILFLIFDIEVAFLFSYGLVFSFLNIIGLWFMFMFIFILALGFCFEYKRKAISW